MNQLKRASKPTLNLKARRLNFYAAMWNVPTTVQDTDNSYQEIVRPGAFTDSLKIRSEVMCTIDHIGSSAFATTKNCSLLLQQDPKGLFASCWIPETQAGDDIIRRIQSGELSGCSFRFTPTVSRFLNGVVERVQMKLHEVCLTSKPAYPQTRGTVHLRTKGNDEYVKHLLAQYKLLTIRYGFKTKVV